MFNDWKLRKEMARTFKVDYDSTKVIRFLGENEI